MRGEKIVISSILRYLWEEGQSARAAAKEMNDVEVPGTVNECAVQNWFRRFKEGDTNLEDKSKSERPSVVEDEALLEMVRQ